MANPGRVTPGMGKLRIDDPDHFTSHAEEARTMAEQIIDPEAKRIIMGVAETYKELAHRVEAHQPKPA
jgi:hypothetical protein